MFSVDDLDARLRKAAAAEGVFIPQRPTVWRAIKRWLSGLKRKLKENHHEVPNP